MEFTFGDWIQPDDEFGWGWDSWHLESMTSSRDAEMDATEYALEFGYVFDGTGGDVTTRVEFFNYPLAIQNDNNYQQTCFSVILLAFDFFNSETGFLTPDNFSVPNEFGAVGYELESTEGTLLSAQVYDYFDMPASEGGKSVKFTDTTPWEVDGEVKWDSWKWPTPSQLQAGFLEETYTGGSGNNGFPIIANLGAPSDPRGWGVWGAANNYHYSGTPPTFPFNGTKLLNGGLFMDVDWRPPRYRYKYPNLSGGSGGAIYPLRQHQRDMW